ncbi:MAG TPA: hypothetical protein VH854_06810 [Thermoanaerobaculia bacterium]|jgi:hypothetical protein|nr:hypothetical protein [Thermoanaerobaculia bacterium]
MRLRSAIPRIAVSVLAVSVLTLVAACHNNDITGANGALGRIAVDAPDSATSGQNFDIHVTATAVGVENIKNTVVTVTLPSPLTVVSVHTDDPQTSATSSSNSVTWTIGNLDANTQSGLTVTAVGTTATQMTGLSVTAQMTATGINAGDAVASDTMTLNP